MSLKGILLLFLFFLTGCAYKGVEIPSTYQVITEEGFQGRTLKGKVFLQGEVFFLNNDNSRGGSYGTFYTTEEELILTVSPPFSPEVFVYWKKGEELRVINPAKKKVYTLKLKELRALDLPSYFLGLREREYHFQKGLLSGEYRFSQENLQGALETNLLKLQWKIKELAFIEEPLPHKDWKDFKEKEINLIF
jgi:hypothetical protein